MNRTRFNHLRADRELEGLQQVPQMPQMPQQTPLSPVRKTTYTRAELLQRGPGAAATRSKRLSTLNPGNRQTSASDAAANRRTSNMTRAHFLPRVAQMGTNNLSNNNGLLNTGKLARDARKPPKSSSYLPSTFGAKLPQQQQHQQQQLLSGCSASSSLSNSSNDLRKIKLAKAFRLPDEQNKSFVYLCKPVKKVKELLMVRTLHNSVDNLLHESATDELSNECFNTMQLELPTLLATTTATAAAESDTCSYCSSLNLPHELAELSSAASSSYRGLLETQLQDVRTREQQLQQLAEQVQREQLSARGEKSREEKEQQQLTQQQSMNEQQQHQQGEQQSQQQSQKGQQQHQKGEQQSEQQQSLKEQQQHHKGEQQSEQQQSLKGQQHSLKGQQQPLFQSSTPQQHLSPQQPESLKEPSAKIDYVCHNIPTLQREIILLQQLGEKLEATLRANMQHAASVTATATATATATSLQPHSMPQSPHDSRTSFYTPRSTLTLFGCDAARLHIQELGWRRVQQQPSHVWQLARVLGCRCAYGCIREFRIETKTLTQLKTADETECFYLPLARDGSLQRTSFRKLRENPNVLLQQLRPLTPSRPFNLLEQDAMFFNSMMSHACVASKLPRETGGEQVQLALRHPPDDVARLLLVATVNATVQCEFPSPLPPPPPAEATSNPATKSKSLASLKSRPSLSRWKCRLAVMRQPPHLVARVRQETPLRPQRVELEPRVQTQLLKTVLVGIAQVAVFLVLIMAFSYPDIRC
ncbi:uncharacterized protein LOC117577312 [Drosophila albomicans]|uniref:Uncharacterized protein LOC117577312 n=1 Tax=Drosophila albomicans TaxID=7291 RepID=A0A9C6T4B6_DROAB|nr:uncharacterized protein LOC117577312 [Drosophila albomicans]